MAVASLVVFTLVAIFSPSYTGAAPTLDLLNRVLIFLLGVVMPVLLAWMWISWILKTRNEGYEGYPADFLGLYGWGLAIGSVVLAVLLSLIPWSRKSSLHAEESTNERDDDDLVPATKEA